MMGAIPDRVVAWARAAQQQAGASETALGLALSVTGPESGFDPSAIGDNGSSFGLTQLHWGGLGSGYDAATLLDPVRNLAIAMTAIDARLRRSGGDAYDALEPWSTRPAAWAIYQSGGAAVGAAVAPGAVAVPTAARGWLVLGGIGVALLIADEVLG